MLPSDELQHAPAVRDENRFVANIPEVTGSKPVKELIYLIGSRRSHQPCNRGICPLFIPIVHRLNKSLLCLVRRRHSTFIDGRHPPAAFLLFHRLRILEFIQRPEYRQPPLALGRSETLQIDRKS